MKYIQPHDMGRRLIKTLPWNHRGDMKERRIVKRYFTKRARRFNKRINL